MSTVAETATLVHGYTMSDVDRIANWAATRYFGTGNGIEERRENAWFAVVETLYSSAETPARYDLVRAAKDAVQAAVNDNMRTHGTRSDGADSIGFSKYWAPVAGEGDFTERIQERIALFQVLALLSPDEYEALAALASMGSNVDAARALCITPRAFGKRIAKARARILPLWYAPETPRSTTTRKRPDADHCTVGHDLREHGQADGRGYVRCRRCERNQKRRENARAA